MSSVAVALSVVVPAYNEQGLVADSVRRLHACLTALAISFEIIVVNDGSRDRTAEIVDEITRELPTVVAIHQDNQGIGGAFRTGSARAKGEYIILWPADMPAETEDLAPYARALGQADVIVGVRRARLGYTPMMRWNSWLYLQLTRWLFDLKVRDVNWIHAYRRQRLLGIRLTQRGIPMLAEALVRLRDGGATFREVDVDMKVRSAGVASASRWRVMWRTLSGLVRFWWQWRQEPRSA